MVHSERQLLSIPPEIKKTLFASQKMVSLDSIHHLPTTAAVEPNQTITRESVVKQVMEEGEVYSIGCSGKRSGEEATGLDNKYNGGNSDLLPGDSAE